jgi:hypothetical protein
MPLVIQPDFSALNVAKLLILRTYWRWNDSPLADAEHTQTEVNAYWDELYDDLQDARYDTRHQGTRVSSADVPERIHFSWSRNYEVDTHVIHLDDKRGLAFNYVTGGGKHGDPDSYPWWQEAWFVTCTGSETVSVTTYSYKDIPDEPAKPE